jgi:hypothetical protein
MGDKIDLDTFDIKRFAEAIVKDANEAVKWERRKLEWILEEKKKATSKSEAA